MYVVVVFKNIYIVVQNTHTHVNYTFDRRSRDSSIADCSDFSYFSINDALMRGKYRHTRRDRLEHNF